MCSVLAVATLAAALGAAPAPATGAGAKPDSRQIKLASPGLTAVNLRKDRADFFAGHFAQALGNRGVRVVTAQEVNAILGLARTQQLMGCDESSTSCMTELADALGVDGVITGSIGQFGPTYQANLVIASNGDGRLLSSVTARADSEQQMLEALTVGAKQAASEVGASLGKPARRFAQQSLYVDPLAAGFGELNLHYARALDPRWSLAAHFGVGLAQPNPEWPGIDFTRVAILPTIRRHFFDTPPFGLYAGGGIQFLTGYGFGNLDGTGVLTSVGFSSFALMFEAGYAIAVLDFLHLSVGFVAGLGISHFALTTLVGGGDDFFLVTPFGLVTGLGWAF